MVLRAIPVEEEIEVTGSPDLYLSSIVLRVSSSCFLPMFASPFPEIVTRATVLPKLFLVRTESKQNNKQRFF